MIELRDLESESEDVFLAVAFSASPTLPLAHLLEQGTTRRAWCFVLSRDGVNIGRVGFAREPTAPAALLGDLPPYELVPFGLELPWHDPALIELGKRLIGDGLARIGLTERLQATVNEEHDLHHAARRRVFEALDMQLFQEKHGYVWEDEGAPIELPGTLVFQSVKEVGREAYASVLGKVGRQTLDRNDRYYYRLAGEQNWARVFMTFLRDEDAHSWLLASLPNGEPVGIVAVSRFDADMATITLIGVVPGHRGAGHVDALLRAGTAAARAAGYRKMLSDADVLNLPMTRAFERNGHRADRRAWHKWHYRA